MCQARSGPANLAKLLHDGVRAAAKASRATDVTCRVPTDGFLGLGVHRRVGNRTGHLFKGQPPARSKPYGVLGAPQIWWGRRSQSGKGRPPHCVSRVGPLPAFGSVSTVFAVAGISASCFGRSPGIAEGLLVELLLLRSRIMARCWRGRTTVWK